MPAGYEPPRFKSKTLQHTKPTLTWDEDSADRKKVLQRKVTAEELQEEDFRAYLAGSSDESGGSSGDDAGDVDDAAAVRARCAPACRARGVGGPLYLCVAISG